MSKEEMGEEEIPTIIVELNDADFKKLEEGEEFVVISADVAGQKVQVVMRRKKKRKRKVDLPQLPQLESESETEK